MPTPIDPIKLGEMLESYDNEQKQYLLNGFLFGFKLGFEGKQTTNISKNLKSTLTDPTVVTQKLEKEVAEGRLSGPYNSPPLQHFRVSPIGLVPKKKPGQFRLIHHLSHPVGESVNEGIPDEQAKVHYSTVDDAVKDIRKLGRGCQLVKIDIEAAFKIIPVHPEDYHLLGMLWQDSFYFDKTLPMGCRSSCSIFDKFSTAIEWVAKKKLGIQEVKHILDDFLLL